MKNCCILFCENPLEPKKVDPDFAEEYVAARQNDFETLLFNFEDFTSGKTQSALQRVKQTDQPVSVIYRGWMLTPAQYNFLFEELKKKNYTLVNSPVQYRNCHYLPDSLQFIDTCTPKTIFQKIEGTQSVDELVEKAKVFGPTPVIIKDYVKSEKHNWDTACFTDNASDSEKLRKSIMELLRLRGEFLNEGVVIREFINLKPLAIHSRSGMPLAEEYRLFFCHQKLIGVYDYWEEGNYKAEKPATSAFESLAKKVDSNFFSMDIARDMKNEFIIVELGDGQVAGIPDSANKNEFYRQIGKCL